jgi:2-polyprenyl-6-methoxyphenol hydroxylase-like FAD-dependent oxidoreductase
MKKTTMPIMKKPTKKKLKRTYDVAIIGAGLAGLSLARQLLLNTDKKILLIEKRAQNPAKRQKYGESLVQVGGYYFGKVLDLEEHLFCEHYMKYNLRFYWKNARRDNDNFEDYSQAYIRPFSNIPCYQIDRNKLEGELLRLNQENPNFTFCAPATELKVSLQDEGPHRVAFEFEEIQRRVKATWVVDTSGRSKFLARQLGLDQPSAIDHGSSFFWVEGLVDIERLTELSLKDRRLKKDRQATGHLPSWLATNHFMGEGLWFWVIPLQGLTSLGLVYDNKIIPSKEVNTPEKVIDWVCREFPLLARDLPKRKILDRGFLKSYSHGCGQTIHPSRWAMAGESGRFTDPLYSPGSDFIAVYNTLIVDAILTDDPRQLGTKCKLYEVVMEALYESLIPSYATSYDALGDQECFTFKYTWELSIYFAFFVFPFINDFCTNQRFVVSYLNRFAELGAINKNLQGFISAYFQWKKTAREPLDAPVFHDFMTLPALKTAESAFYQVGVSVEEGRQVLDEQLVSLRELARFIVAHIYSEVLLEDAALTDAAFVEGIDLRNLRFDPEAMATDFGQCSLEGTEYQWSFDPFVLRCFRTPQRVPTTKSVAAGG